MPALTPVQEARSKLGEHCANCPTCKVQWLGETPVRQQCPTAEDLGLMLRRIQKETERTS